ncbi:MAG: 50S ribosomal protein L6 [Candidatus Bathyarchaeia archaeon]
MLIWQQRVVTVAREVYVRRVVKVPPDVRVKLLGKKVVVEGPLGSIEKDFSHARSLHLSLSEEGLVIEAFNADKKTYSIVNTLASKIENMIIGVQRGFRYRMKIVFSHFPMNVKVDEKNHLVVIENFMGGRGKIMTRIEPGVKVRVERDDVVIEGIDKEAVAQTAANIREATKLRGKRRMSPHGREGGPGILDGIYVYAKENMK